MFKYKIGQHVWFLISDPATEEDPEYLEGNIIKQDAVADLHGSPDAVYEIRAVDGVYERDEEDLYASFDELSTAVTEDLQYWIDHARQRVKEIKEELDEAWADKEAAKQRLARWAERLKKGSGDGT